MYIIMFFACHHCYWEKLFIVVTLINKKEGETARIDASEMLVSNNRRTKKKKNMKRNKLLLPKKTGSLWFASGGVRTRPSTR